MVPVDSEGISPVPPYSGVPTHNRLDPYRTLTVYGAFSQRLRVQLIVCCRVLLPRLGRNPIGLGWSGLARHYYRNHSCFLLLRLLRCFSSPRLPSCYQESWFFKPGGCPIRTQLDQPLPAGPQSVSSLATSFFAIRSLRHPPDALLLRTPYLLNCYGLMSA